MKIAGIDPSLTATGVAVIDTEDRLTIDTRTIGSAGHRDDSWEDRWVRIVRLAHQIVQAADWVDLAVMEAPTLSQGRQGGHLDRHGLWWAIYGGLAQAYVPVLVIPASTRAKYLAGRGNAPKDACLAAAIRRYPQAEIEDNNQADAVGLAALGARILDEPIEDHLPKANLDALAKVVAPEGVAA